MVKDRETKLEQAFMCLEHDTLVLTTKKTSVCPQCHKNMDNIGWFETNEEHGDEPRKDEIG